MLPVCWDPTCMPTCMRCTQAKTAKLLKVDYFQRKASRRVLSSVLSAWAHFAVTAQHCKRVLARAVTRRWRNDLSCTFVAWLQHARIHRRLKALSERFRRRTSKRVRLICT